MIEWIAAYSKKCGYKPGVAFISSKPTCGINHKEFWSHLIWGQCLHA
jgi:hypothetical protein